MSEASDTPDSLPPLGEFQRVDIVDEMKNSYLDYAMSVIVARALPDVRDGLKPVHRRILFASQEGGMVAGRPYRKSAKIVGDELHLTVADNGLGIKPEVVERLLIENTPVSKGSGVGLKNVNERIKLYFGDRYGVLIKSEPDEGTWITLVLPIIRYETEEASDVGKK